MLRRAAPLVVVIVLCRGAWTVSDSFDGPSTGQSLESAWQEYRTFGERENGWRVEAGSAVRSSAQDRLNSEVVAFFGEAPPFSDQQVSVMVEQLEVSPDEQTSWASVGVLTRGSAESRDGLASELSAYNGELVMTDEFGEMQYLLLLWLVDGWSHGDPPEDVAVLASERLGPRVEFPVRLTVSAQDSTITVRAVQDDSTTTSLSVEDTTLDDGRVGLISSLIAPTSARIEVDDFSAREAQG